MALGSAPFPTSSRFSLEACFQTWLQWVLVQHSSRTEFDLFGWKYNSRIMKNYKFYEKGYSHKTTFNLNVPSEDNVFMTLYCSMLKKILCYSSSSTAAYKHLHTDTGALQLGKYNHSLIFQWRLTAKGDKIMHEDWKAKLVNSDSVTTQGVMAIWLRSGSKLDQSKFLLR